MEKPEFFVTPGYGERLRDLLHYSQAVRIGNRVEISGQGGWDDDLRIPEALEEEIAQASAMWSARWQRPARAGNMRAAPHVPPRRCRHCSRHR